jgi:L-phenylalanine/L-methionine N-acetyltransferase
MPLAEDKASTAAPPRAAPSAAPGLVIRAREAEDYAAIADLVSLPGVRWGTLRLPFASREETKAWIAQGAGGLHIVAVLDGRLVGSASIITNKGRRSHVGMIGMIVHDDFCRRGIGTAMLAALIDAADNWLALRRLELTVYVDNAGAIALYEKSGFTIEGTRRQDAFRGGTYVDSYAMARLRAS